MVNIDNLHPEYITDENGQKKSVILPISDFQELIDDIEDLAAIAERKDEPTVSHDTILLELKTDELL